MSEDYTLNDTTNYSIVPDQRDSHRGAGKTISFDQVQIKLLSGFTRIEFDGDARDLKEVRIIFK